MARRIFRLEKVSRGENEVGRMFAAVRMVTVDMIRCVP